MQTQSTLFGVTTRYVFFFLLSLLVLSMPSHVGAYFTTGQNEIELDDGSALFLIEYTFGHKKYDLHMPVLATSESDAVSSLALVFDVRDEGGNSALGSSRGIVLSGATLSAGPKYVVRKGDVGTFLLFVLFTPEKSEPEKKYQLQVTHLPFSFNGKQDLKLNPSELEYYKTDLLAL